MSGKIKAVSFDLWDVIIDDDSDEPKRTARGLRPKAAERRHLVWQALNREAPVTPGEVALAYDVAEAAFNNLWRDHFITWTLDERLGVILNGLGRTLPADERENLLEALGRIELDVPPNPVPGMREALEALARRYKLGIVSDAINTPGHHLRELLECYDLKRYFSGFAFSDEVGFAKPHPAMFEAAAHELGVALDEMVHVGDRDHNDVKGPQALGMKAILFTAARDADKDATSADLVCNDPAGLPGAVESLAGEAGSPEGTGRRP